eukprot:COSAG01_NODE_247_length_20443_cov_52.339543_15_plen_95_part_00
MAAAAAVTACHRVGRVAGVGVVGLGGLLGGAAAVGCATSPGFRRSLRFIPPSRLSRWSITPYAHTRAGTSAAVRRSWTGGWLPSTGARRPGAWR